MKKFNARERSENFTREELSRLIRFARNNSKKIYVTFNTLIKETEIEQVFDELSFLDDVKPDGVIIQDLGVYYLLKTYFPRLDIHGSTQMAVHNSEGVKLLEQLGFTRVILERQVTLHEIAEIKSRTSLELEVFIHGALCCSLSGICLFSSWMGGWSGNRGKCKQPCRRRYFSKQGNGFFFSTNDLATLEDMAELKSMGLTSFKIEGRLKKSDYVVPVVRAYRLLLDAKPGREEEVLSTVRDTLSRSGGRYWSTGFRRLKDFDAVIDHRKLGVSGTLIGKVAGVKENGFFITPKSTIHLKDELRIQPPSGDEGPSFTVTKISAGGSPKAGQVRSIPAKRKGFLHCDKRAAFGDLVYRIGYSREDFTGRAAEVLPFRKSVDLDIDVSPESITVAVLTGAGPQETEASGGGSGPSSGLVWRYETTVPPAEKRPLSEEDVEREFRKIQLTDINCAAVSVTVHGHLFMLNKTLRNIRQAFTEWLDKQKEVVLSNKPEKPLSVIPPEILQRLETTIAVKTFDRIPSAIEGTAEKEAVFALPLKVLVEQEHPVRKNTEVILPSFCPEGTIDTVRKRIEICYSRGVRRFRVTSLYGFSLLDGYTDIVIVTGFPLPAANRFACFVLFGQGARKVQAWVELEQEGLLPLKEFFSRGGDPDRADAVGPGVIELYTYGRVPLLQTRATVPVTGAVQDSRGGGFIVKREGKITTLYSEKVLDIDPGPGFSRFIDLLNARPGETNGTVFNFDRELV